MSIYSCQNWKISTVEGIGNAQMGYHPIQEAMVKYNGTQCGFCSPGMVMNMFDLYEKDTLTMKQVENFFGGSMCRCTGYRPILSAFKSLCTDADPAILGLHPDIEDLNVCRRQRPCKISCGDMFCGSGDATSFQVKGDSKWYKVFTVNDIVEVLQKYPGKTFMFVAGNTAKGQMNIYFFKDNQSQILGVFREKNKSMSILT